MKKREYMGSSGALGIQSSLGPESTLEVVVILQPRDVLFQFFGLCAEVTAVLEVLFGRAAFCLQTIVFATQRRYLLLQRLVLGLELGQISGRRPSIHDGQRCNRSPERAATA